MSFELPLLNYNTNSLEPHIDTKTMEIHHGKHHAGYTNNLNNAIAGTDLEGKSIEEVRDLTRQFKAMMSIHEESIGADDPPPGDGHAFELGDLEALKGVVKFPVRIKCATLSWNTLLTGLDELEV